MNAAARPITNTWKFDPGSCTCGATSFTGWTLLIGRRLKELERTPEKAWWDCVKNDMESLGLFQKDVQFNNK